MNQVPLKILFVITKSNWGGAQKYVFDLATNLPKDSFESVVAYGGSGSPGSGVGKLAQLLQESRIRSIFIESFARDVHLTQDIRAFFELLRICKKERPDIVHLNSSKAGGLGALAARISGVPQIVFTVHGLASNEDRRVLSRLFISLATTLTLALCHTVIVVSKADLEKVRHSHAQLIYNGIQPIDLYDRATARPQLVPDTIAQRHESDVWVVTNAELHPNKNLFTAIEAVALHNQTHLPKIFYVLVSEGELRIKLEEDIARRGMRESVFLTGFIEGAARYLRAFDIFFLPSKKEGLPYVLLEAGMAELPVVSSRIGGIPEIVEDGVSGYLHDPKDAAGFAESLASLSRDSEKREAMGRSLHLHVSDQFSFEKMIEQTLALYTAALK